MHPSVSRLVLVVALTAMAMMAATRPVAAETPNEVVEDLNDGVYIHQSRAAEVDADAFSGVIAEATRDGLQFIVVVPEESVPYPAAFALRVRQAAEADIALVISEEGTIESSVTEDEGEREIQAIEAARAAAEPGEAASAFYETLTGEPERSVPDVVRRIANFVFYLTLILGAVVFIELALRRFKNRRIRI